MPRPFNLIVACAENRAIGFQGRLPWRIPEDWRYFRQQTAQATVVLGRLSFESWRSVLEDGRHAVVVTRNESLAGERVRVAGSLSAGLTVAAGMPGEIFVCGGQRLFEEAITRPEAQRLYLTLVHADLPGDRFFPAWQQQFPRVIESRESADANFRYTFMVLARD